MGLHSQISQAREGVESQTSGAGLYMNPDFDTSSSGNTGEVIRLSWDLFFVPVKMVIRLFISQDLCDNSQSNILFLDMKREMEGSG